MASSNSTTQFEMDPKLFEFIKEFVITGENEFKSLTLEKRQSFLTTFFCTGLSLIYPSFSTPISAATSTAVEFCGKISRVNKRLEIDHVILSQPCAIKAEEDFDVAFRTFWIQQGLIVFYTFQGQLSQVTRKIVINSVTTWNDVQALHILAAFAAKLCFQELLESFSQDEDAVLLWTCLIFERVLQKLNNLGCWTLAFSSWIDQCTVDRLHLRLEPSSWGTAGETTMEITKFEFFKIPIVAFAKNSQDESSLTQVYIKAGVAAKFQKSPYNANPIFLRNPMPSEWREFTQTDFLDSEYIQILNCPENLSSSFTWSNKNEGIFKILHEKLSNKKICDFSKELQKISEKTGQVLQLLETGGRLKVKRSRSIQSTGSDPGLDGFDDRKFSMSALEQIQKCNLILDIFIHKVGCQSAILLECVLPVLENLRFIPYSSDLCSLRLQLTVKVAKIYRDSGQFTQALTLLQSQREGVQTLILEGHAKFEDDLTFLEIKKAGIYLAQGEYRLSRNILNNEIIKSRGRKLDDHPLTVSAKYYLARLDDLEGQLNVALGGYQSILETQERSLGSCHGETVKTERRMADILFDQGRFQDALAIYEKVCRKDGERALLWLEQSKKFEKDHRVYFNHYRFAIKSRHNYHRIVKTLGRNSPEDADTSALESYKGLYKEEVVIFGEGHPDTLKTIESMARIIQSQGRRDQAKQLFQQVYHRRREILGVVHPLTLHAWLQLSI